MGDINADFIGNHSSAYGGAIGNADSSTIGNITGKFDSNYINGEYLGRGGAIYNDFSTIGDIYASFTNNKITALEATTSGFGVFGGAIGNYTSGHIKSITGIFKENSIHASARAFGGAIANYSRSTIGDINADFISNSVLAENVYGSARGGAIYNAFDSSIGNITGNFIKNTVTVSKGPVEFDTMTEPYGGAIYNESATIGDINANFIENGAIVDGTKIANAQGGAIYNAGTIGNLNGLFKGNYIKVKNEVRGSVIRGGALYLYGNTGNITADFDGNFIDTKGTLAITSGGAISSGGQTGDIKGNFTNNYINAEESNPDYTANVVGGALHNSFGNIKSLSGNFVNNHISLKIADDVEEGLAAGGAVYNDGTIGETDDSGKVVSGGIVNSSFVNNYVKADGINAQAKGGAIYSNTEELNIISDNHTSVYSGNKTITNGVEEQNAIYVDGSDNYSSEWDDDLGKSVYTVEEISLNLKTQNNGKFIFDDTITGDISQGTKYYRDYVDGEDVTVWLDDKKVGYNLNITGDDTGAVVFNNDVKNANITLSNTNLYLGRDNVLNDSLSLNLNSGSLSMMNGTTGNMHLPSINLNGNVSVGVDADLAAKSMDTITADAYNITPGSVLNVTGVNLLSDAANDVTVLKFTDGALAENTIYTGAQTAAFSPIYKYNVSYSANPEDGMGYFTFARGSSGSSDSYNPAVLPTSVATQAGGYTTQLQTFNYAFQHSDNFMAIPYLERVAIKNSNRYALSPTGDATDVGTFSPLLTKHQHNGFWLKPYASFENIPLKNGPKVGNINYGTLVGYDSEMKEIKHGIDRVLTGYIGYNGASQRYSGIDTNQNGGILGGTATFYKGNFFNATTLSAGASAGNTSTMYGSENYTMLLAGIGNKTGYNFEFKEGRVILQPSMLISYTFVNTFDYTNAAGLRIESDPLNAIQLAPGIKLIGNTKNGWQPYLGVSMVWNLLDKSKVTANDVRLPEMSIKPYVQYGLGVQKCFKEDTMTAYGQAMIHNGGRNGISLSAGLRWRVGYKK